MDSLALAVQTRFRAKYGASKHLAIPLPGLYAKQQEIESQGKRFNVLDIGRRAGKTFLGDYLVRKALGAGKRVGWFAPSYKYLLEVWQNLDRVLKPYAIKANATERRIELPNGGVFECWTLDGTDDPGRGRKYHLAIIDEAAIAPNLKNAWEQAIKPTLTDYAGDAWFLSTPKGLNYFHDLYQRGLDPLQPEWACWQLPSSVNPFLPASELEAARIELPEQVYQQEYLAQFIQNDGAVFRNVDAACVADPTTPEQHAGHLIVASVDWGRAHDFTAVSIVCCHCRKEIHLDRFNQIGWAIQRDRILTLCQQWSVAELVVETNSIGGPNLEALHDAAPKSLRVSGWEMTGQSKPKLIQGLALSLERVTFKWLRDPVGRHELLSYEATVSPSLNIKYSAPDGGFDDTVIARALARYLAEAQALPIAPAFERALDQFHKPPQPSETPSDYYTQPAPLPVVMLDDTERITRQRSAAMAAFRKTLKAEQDADRRRRGEDNEWEAWQ